MIYENDLLFLLFLDFLALGLEAVFFSPITLKWGGGIEGFPGGSLVPLSIFGHGCCLGHQAVRNPMAVYPVFHVLLMC